MFQRVLITAGASGIGREMARAFAAHGAKIHVCDIDALALDALRAELPTLSTSTCDISKRDDIERMVPQAIQQLGGLDVLINNAGVAGPTAPLQEVKPDDWDKVVAVNLTGTYLVTRLAIPALKRSASGVILIMSSMAGRLGYPNRSPYAATKWALVGLAKTLSIELGPDNIRVNAILPGCVAGPRIDRVFEGRSALTGKPLSQVRDEALSIQSLHRLVDPKDIAALCVFLASDAAKSISGQAIPIDNDTQKAT